MTRINTIPAELLMDEHLLAAHREGARPLNEIKSGKDCIKNAPSNYKLGQGHVKFARKHLLWTKTQFDQAKSECLERGFNIKDYDFDVIGIKSIYLNDYKPTTKDYRLNLARLCARWRKRTKPYHFNGVKIDCYESFQEWLNMVKKELSL